MLTLRLPPANLSRSPIRSKPRRTRRIHIEKINWPFLRDLKTSPAEYGAGLKLAIERGWLWLHESGTCVKFTQAGAELFA
jgi:hypothetical protein